MLGRSGIGGERWLLAVIAQTPRITLTLEKKKKKIDKMLMSEFCLGTLRVMF